MSMHGVGHRRRQVSLTHLLAHVSRDELDGGLHFRHHAFGLFDAIEARLAEPFLLSNGANRVDVLLDIPRNERAVATHAALPQRQWLQTAISPRQRKDRKDCGSALHGSRHSRSGMNSVTTATSFPSLCRQHRQHGRKCEAQEGSWSRTNKQREAWLRP